MLAIIQWNDTGYPPPLPTLCVPRSSPAGVVRSARLADGFECSPFACSTVSWYESTEGTAKATTMPYDVTEHKPLACTAIITCGLALSACVTTTNTQEALAVADPKNMPVSMLTSMTPYLRCMDNLFLRNPPKREIRIYSKGLPPDHSQIVLTTLGEMTRESGAFTFQDFDPGLDKDNADTYFDKTTGANFREAVVPTHYIKLAMTHYDDTVIDNSGTLGVSLPTFGRIGLPAIGFSKGQAVSVVAVDMALINYRNREGRGDLISSNVIAFARAGTTANAAAQAVQHISQQVYSTGEYGGQPYYNLATGNVGGAYVLGGLNLSLRTEERESPSLAVRKVIQLSTLELMGRALEVPYQTCLPKELQSAQPARNRSVPVSGVDGAVVDRLSITQELKSYLARLPSPEEAYRRGLALEARGNDGAAFQLYDYAAARRHSGAALQIAQMYDPRYSDSRTPFPPDAREAMRWYRVAYDLRNGDAQERISGLRAWAIRRGEDGNIDAKYLVQEWRQQ